MWAAISGTPGVGKSTVADLIGKKLGWKVIHLGELAKKKKLYSGYDRKWKTWIVDIEAIQEEVGKIKEKNLIVESHFSHDMPVDIVIMLRLSPRELRGRLKRRGWNSSKTEENVEAEIMEICKSEAIEGGKRVFEIDTTNKKPADIAKEAINIIKKYNR